MCGAKKPWFQLDFPCENQSILPTVCGFQVVSRCKPLPWLGLCKEYEISSRKGRCFSRTRGGQMVSVGHLRVKVRWSGGKLEAIRHLALHYITLHYITLHCIYIYTDIHIYRDVFFFFHGYINSSSGTFKTRLQDQFAANGIIIFNQ